MRFEFAFDIASAHLPVMRVGKPRPVILFHVAPPSREVKRPLPGPPLSRPQVRISSGHMPANRIRELFGSITRSEHPVFSSVNSTRSHVVPPFVERYTP